MSVTLMCMLLSIVHHYVWIVCIQPPPGCVWWTIYLYCIWLSKQNTKATCSTFLVKFMSGWVRVLQWWTYRGQWGWRAMIITYTLFTFPLSLRDLNLRPFTWNVNVEEEESEETRSFYFATRHALIYTLGEWWHTTHTHTHTHMQLGVGGIHLLHFPILASSPRDSQEQWAASNAAPGEYSYK